MCVFFQGVLVCVREIGLWLGGQVGDIIHTITIILDFNC